MNRRQTRTSSRKSRKTFSLSRDAVMYLETFQARKKEASLSGAVEALIHERKEQEAADKLAAQTRAYYDSLTPAELGDSEAWGKFAESEVADSEV
jgi:hypothetical protein